MHAYTRLLTHAAIFAVLGIIASGCGDGSGKKYIINTTYKVDPKPVDPTPPTPPTTPTDPAPIDSKTPSTPAAVLRMDYVNSPQGIANSASVAQLKLVALKDGVSLRRLRISTNVAIPNIEAFNYVASSGVTSNGTSGTIAPVTTFTIESATRLDMGYLPLAGDTLYVSLSTDATGLDGKTVTFTVTSVDVSVGSNAVETMTDKLPAAFSVSFGEFPQIEGIAGVTSQAAIKSTSTVLAEFNLRNIGTHDVDLLKVRFGVPVGGLNGVVSLKVKVGSLMINLTNNGTFYSGQTIEVDTTAMTIIRSPGQSILVQLIGDTVTAGAGTLVLADLARVQIHGDATRALWVYESVDTNFSYSQFATTFVGVDNTTVVRQQTLTKMTGPVDGSFAVMRLKVDNNTAAVISISQVDVQALSSDIPNLWGEAWLQLQTAAGSLRIGPNRSYVGQMRLTLPLDTGTALMIPANGSIIIEVFATAPGMGTSDTFQMKLDALPTSQGLPDLALTPPTAPSILN